MERDKYYENVYQSMFSTGGIGFISSLVHKKMEIGLSSEMEFDSVLELGAGHGQHLRFVRHNFNSYLESDLRELNIPDRLDPRVSKMALNAMDLRRFNDSAFDRVILSCLLIHLVDPEVALMEIRRVVKNGGLISIYLPCEPGLLLRIARSLSTRRKANKMGVDHLAFNYREHVTYFSRVDFFIKSIFDKDKISKKFWPFVFRSWNSNLAAFYQIKINK